jgi:hypothetical protein
VHRTGYLNPGYVEVDGERDRLDGCRDHPAFEGPCLRSFPLVAANPFKADPATGKGEGLQRLIIMLA